jgi:hypothetical protein
MLFPVVWQNIEVLARGIRIGFDQGPNPSFGVFESIGCGKPQRLTLFIYLEYIVGRKHGAPPRCKLQNGQIFYAP